MSDYRHHKVDIPCREGCGSVAHVTIRKTICPRCRIKRKERARKKYSYPRNYVYFTADGPQLTPKGKLLFPHLSEKELAELLTKDK